jgi:hypothetical protein
MGMRHIHATFFPLWLPSTHRQLHAWAIFLRLDLYIYGPAIWSRPLP